MRRPLNRHEPERTCIGCGKKGIKKRFLRFVCRRDGCVVADGRQHLQGRGAYVCPDVNCFKKAIRLNRFARAFRRKTNCSEVMSVMGLSENDVCIQKK